MTDPRPDDASPAVPVEKFPAWRRGRVRKLVEAPPAANRDKLAGYVELSTDRVSAVDERWQHGQELQPAIAPRFPDRIASGVSTLRKSDLIGDADVTSAERWIRDYVCGIEGVRDSAYFCASKSDAHDALLARSKAVTRHREISCIIGDARTRWANAFLVEDLSFSAMAERFLPGRTSGRTEMIGHLATLLSVMTGLYAAIDRQAPKPQGAASGTQRRDTTHEPSTNA
jgi:hypothetical protein